jgi:hypothetical protein
MHFELDPKFVWILASACGSANARRGTAGGKPPITEEPNLFSDYAPGFIHE